MDCSPLILTFLLYGFELIERDFGGLCVGCRIRASRFLDMDASDLAGVNRAIQLLRCRFRSQ